jgi:unsaturated rhamnogalacturonyl hydrolase
LIEEHARSQQTGRLYHGWDESRKQAWADKDTGTSHIFWARGMRWYMMALVDSLPYYPKDDPNRATLVAILNRTAASVVRYQDKQTGLWYQVLDKPGAQGNYFESSAACMFTYALQKGVRLGYLPEHYSQNAARAWQGILSHFIQTDARGFVTITGTVKAIGLGGAPYNDGTFAYYVGSPVVRNDPKGVGAFLLASTEMESAPDARVAGGETVMVDAWFNSQQRQNAAGQEEYFHYKWNDYSDSGLSILGHIFASHGATLATLYQAPTTDRLKGAQFYIIVSPDNPAKNPHPHYVQPQNADQVAEWVKRGGVLVLMENDPANADITHLDLIADRFGIHFDDVLKRHIIGDEFAPAYIAVSGGGPIFHQPHMLYMKDTCAISLKALARALLEDKAGIVMATAKYGRGTVFAVGVDEATGGPVVDRRIRYALRPRLLRPRYRSKSQAEDNRQRRQCATSENFCDLHHARMELRDHCTSAAERSGCRNRRKSAISMYQKLRTVSAHLCSLVPLYGIGDSLSFIRRITMDDAYRLRSIRNVCM